MKISGIKRILKESLLNSGEEGLPGWLDYFLQPLNDFIEKATTALQGKLTFEDNFSSRTHTQSFDSGVKKVINPQSFLRVSGVLCLHAKGKEVTGFGWDYESSGDKIGVTITFNGGGTADCKIEILLG